MTSTPGETDQTMHRHDPLWACGLSPQDLSKWKGIWQTVKDEYKEGLLVYRTLPNLREPGSTLETMRPTLAVVDLLVPQLFQPFHPVPRHPAFKVTIMQIEGHLSLEMLNEAVTSQMHKYLDRALGRLVMLDAHSEGSTALRAHPVITPCQIGLCELVHTLRQWILFYLHDVESLDYKLHDCFNSIIRQTSTHKCFIHECNSEFCDRCSGPEEVCKRMKDRSQRLAHDLLLRQRRSLDLNVSIPAPDAADIRLSVDVTPNAWQYLMKNGFLLPREQLLRSGMVELECEIASGPPGLWRNVGEDLQAQRRDPALARSHGESIPEVGSIVVRRGEAAVVAAIDRWSSPPSFIIRLMTSLTSS
mgnify:CR=1 FL=1